MKRHAFLLALGVVVVAALVVAALMVEKSRASAWRPLPKGGSVRIYAITHGTAHRIEAPGEPVSKRLQGAIALLRTGSMRPLLVRLRGGNRGSSSTSTTEPSLMVWFQVQHPGSGIPSALARDGEVTLSDGQILRTFGGSGGGSGDFYTTAFHFSPLPYREKTLHVSAEFDGKRIQFDAPNPAYDPDLPAWQPEPLPLTRTAGDVTLTLREIALVPGRSKHDPPWQPRPSWSITRGGKAAAAWFDIRAEYLDAGGNCNRTIGLLSEPAWNVRATVTRKAAYPFADDDVRWVATIEPPADGQKPQTYSLVALDADTRARGIKVAGIFGTGQFEITEDGVGSVGPAVKAPYASGYRTDYDHDAKSILVTMGRPGFIMLSTASTGVIVFHDHERGFAVALNEEWSHGGPMGRLGIHRLPDRPVDFGIAAEAPLKFEFLVRPPAKPGLDTGAP